MTSLAAALERIGGDLAAMVSEAFAVDAVVALADREILEIMAAASLIARSAEG